MTVRSTEEILGNVAWLISQFDDEGLEEVQNIPFLEMAKHILITRRNTSLSTLQRTLKEKRLVEACSSNSSASRECIKRRAI